MASTLDLKVQAFTMNSFGIKAMFSVMAFTRDTFRPTQSSSWGSSQGCLEAGCPCWRSCSNAQPANSEICITHGRGRVLLPHPWPVTSNLLDPGQNYLLHELQIDNSVHPQAILENVWQHSVTLT